MDRQELVARIIAGGTRPNRSPALPRATCPECGKKGLGNAYTASDGFTYRQCKYCCHREPQ